MYDYLISNARIVDGTGGPAYAGSVGIRGSRIVAVGDCDEPAARTLDAEGRVVAPGFVDLHTHYDAQLAWDPTASPSVQHGVTTVFAGNCGFGLAPLGPTDADYIKGMMARVEGVPIEALSAGLDWKWRSYGEWLDRLDGRLGVNAGFMVAHSTVRRFVMGDDATARAATPQEIVRMCEVVDEAIRRGGLGLSTSFNAAHKDGNGDPVPSRLAEASELLELAAVVGRHPGTTLELVPSSLTHFTERDLEMMIGMSLAARRPLNWNLMRVTSRNPEAHLHQLAASDEARARGARVVALVLTHGMRPYFSFVTGFILEDLPGWSEVFTLPVPERSRALRDEAVVARLRQGAAGVAGDRSRGIYGVITQWQDVEVVDTVHPDNAAYEGRTIGDIARERGADPFDTLLDIVLRDDLRTGLFPAAFEDDEESRRLRAEVWTDPRAVIGGSDAGAHVAMECGAKYPTTLLADSVRERGLISLEEAIHQLTQVPARLYGVKDRGRVAPGCFADLVVFDPDTVAPERPAHRSDFPGGASRLYADAVGIEAVLVNGEEVLRDGETTGFLPGALLRSGRDTETVEVDDLDLR